MEDPATYDVNTRKIDRPLNEQTLLSYVVKGLTDGLTADEVKQLALLINQLRSDKRQFEILYHAKAQELNNKDQENTFLTLYINRLEYGKD